MLLRGVMKKNVLGSTDGLELLSDLERALITRCPYCRKSGHTNMQCTTPHVLCHTTISCIIPSYHSHFGEKCPAANCHMTNNNDEEAYHPAEEGNPALEEEGYVGHEDEEGDGES
jgi:hypothetical protein